MRPCAKLLVTSATVFAISAGSAFAAANPVRPTVDRPAVSGELLVKFKRGTARRDRSDIVSKRHGRIIATVPGLDIDAVRFSDIKGHGQGAQTQAKARD